VRASLPSVIATKGFLFIWGRMFRMKAWGLWLLASLLPALLTKNPAYLLLAILSVGVVYFALCQSTPTGRQWTVLLRFGLLLGLFSVGFNILFVSAGATHLASLPALRLNVGGALVKIGGDVTLESLVYGLAQALSLLGMLTVLATFNAVADHYELLRSTPRFLYQSAIVLSIAVTFVPQMMAAQAEIREAQALRGHRFRTLRDLPPLFIALLAEGLERSITLAESMSARGFGSPSGRGVRSGPVLQTLIALALFILICGTAALTYLPVKTAGALMLAVGGGMLTAILWSIGEGTQRSRYRRGVWRRHDLLLAGASLAASLVWLGIWFLDPASLIFYPYPRISWPAFQPLVGLAILLTVAPAILHAGHRAQSHD
jgi:energy-coupling factor transport system permease protein